MNYDEEERKLQELKKNIRKEVKAILEQKGWGPGDTISGCWQRGTIELQILEDGEILFEKNDSHYHWDHATIDEMFKIWRSAIKALYA